MSKLAASLASRPHVSYRQLAPTIFGTAHIEIEYGSGVLKTWDTYNGLNVYRSQDLSSCKRFFRRREEEMPSIIEVIL